MTAIEETDDMSIFRAPQPEDAFQAALAVAFSQIYAHGGALIQERRWKRAFAQHGEIVKSLESELICLSCGCLAEDCSSYSLHGLAEAHRWCPRKSA